MKDYSSNRVSIIIVNYNTYPLVLNCIQSIKEKTLGCNYEIIVVDNNSPNREIENLSNEFADVNLILHPYNNGFGSGNNVGAKIAKGNYLFFLNSDTLLVNDAISILLNYMINKPNVGVCGGNLYSINLSPTTSFSIHQPGILSDLDYFFFNVFSKLKYKKSTFFNFSDESMSIKGSISGANYLIKTELFNEIGGFDEDFFMYYEETELSYRVLKKKYKIHNIPSAKIIHFEGGSENIKERSLDWTLASKKKYFLKTSNLLSFYISNVIFYMTILQRLFLFKLVGNKQKSAYWLGFFNWANKKLINR